MPDQPNGDARGMVQRHLIVAERSGWELMSQKDHVRLAAVFTLMLLLVPLTLYWIVGSLPILWVQAGFALFVVFPMFAFFFPWLMRKAVGRQQE
ncbi:MAG: hypothetical protein H0T73_10375 [Ardenticatenales bacterium]|nr:hypothetical protein [Ardenticatenales bacterium]